MSGLDMILAGMTKLKNRKMRVIIHDENTLEILKKAAGGGLRHRYICVLSW